MQRNNRSEADVAHDPHVAESRDTGGRPRTTPSEGAPDGTSTTGTDRNETFVGRVAGDDAGYSGETGAEARAEAGER